MSSQDDWARGEASGSYVDHVDLFLIDFKVSHPWGAVMLWARMLAAILAALAGPGSRRTPPVPCQFDGEAGHFDGEEVWTSVRKRSL